MHWVDMISSNSTQEITQPSLRVQPSGVDRKDECIRTIPELLLVVQRIRDLEFHRDVMTITTMVYCKCLPHSLSYRMGCTVLYCTVYCDYLDEVIFRT